MIVVPPNEVAAMESDNTFARLPRGNACNLRRNRYLRAFPRGIRVGGKLACCLTT